MTVSHKKSKSGSYYINSQTLEDYYASTSEKEPPGIWHFSAGPNGPVSELFGMRNGSKFDQDTTDSFADLCKGFNPEDGSKLTQNSGHKERTALHDFTFSAPKSFSIAWGLTGSKELRNALGEGQLNSVRVALDFLSDRGAYVRMGAQGRRPAKGALISALFEHGSSRENDPQLHTHGVILNVVQRPDGKFGALEVLKMMPWQGAAASLYHAGQALAARKAGARIRMEGKIPEIEDIPQEVRDAFSKRRKRIMERAEKVQAGLGLTVDAAMASRGLLQMATIETRDSKSALTRAELTDLWLKEGRSLGYTDAQIMEAFAHEPYKELDRDELMELAREAIAELTETNATFREPALITAMAVKLCGLATPEQILATSEAIKAELLHAEHFDLDTGETSTVFTTEEQLLCEEHIVDLVQRVAPEHKLDASTVEAAIQKRDNALREAVAKDLKKTKGADPSDAKGLEQEQKDAIRHICLSDDAVSVLEGTAGAGKTFSIKSVGEIYAAAGYEVHGLSAAWTQALNLKKEASLNSGRAIAGWLIEIEKGNIILDPKSVVILDEAGMVGTRDMRAVLRACDRAGCKVVLLGDTLQQSSVSAGDALRMIVAECGSARLDKIRRQRNEDEREAVKDLFAGRGEDGFKPFAKTTQIHTGADAVHQAMVNDWITSKRKHNDTWSPVQKDTAAAARALFNGRDGAPGHEKIQTHLMQATDNASVAELNRMAHDQLKAAGLLGRESIQLRTMDSRDDSDRFEFCVGDEVVFRTNNKKLDAIEEDNEEAAEAIYNRTRCVIVGITDKGHLKLMTSDKELVVMDPQDPKWTARKHKAVSLQHAYAQTVTSSQGATVDFSFNKDGLSLNRRSSGVMMSRHREQAHVYIDREVRYEAKMRRTDATDWHHIAQFSDAECMQSTARSWGRESEKVNATDLQGWQVGGDGRFVDARAALGAEQLNELLADFDRMAPGKEAVQVLPFQESDGYNLQTFPEAKGQGERALRSKLEEKAILDLGIEGIGGRSIEDAKEQGFMVHDELGRVHFCGYRPNDIPGGNKPPVNRYNEQGQASPGAMRGRFPPVLKGDPKQVHLVHSGQDALALWTKADQTGAKRPTVIVTGGDARSATALKATRDLIAKADEVTIHPKAQSESNPTKRLDDECVRAAGGKKPVHAEQAPREQLKAETLAREQRQEQELARKRSQGMTPS